MSELIASQPGLYCYVGAPNPEDSIRFYSDGSWVDDENCRSGFVDFKEVMRLEAIALSADVPKMSLEECAKWFGFGKA